MPLRDSEAIVLRSFPLGEADRIVSLLTRSMGRIRGVARGARRTKSQFGSTLQMLSHVRVWFYEREGRDLVRISQCELVESFLDAQKDYSAGVALSLVSEVSEAVLPEHEPSDPAFRLILLTARAVRDTGKFALPLSYFLLWTVKLAGWLPGLDRCAKCARAIEAESGYAAAGMSGLMCSKCRRPGMLLLSGKTLAAARRMLETRLDRLVTDPGAPMPGADLDRYLLDVVEHQIERKLTTRRMLETAQ